jgi:hypothetical protein
MPTTDISPEATRRLESTRQWVLEGKRRLYKRGSKVSLIDVYFAARSAYRIVQRVPIVGRVATGSKRVLRSVAGRGA